MARIVLPNGEDITVHEWPGHVLTVAGSLKKIPAKFSRPWQAPIPEPPDDGSPHAACRFHNPKERLAAHRSVRSQTGEQWLVLDSAFAPERPYHRLILPDRCWSGTKTRCLGGLAEIETALELAVGQLHAEDADVYSTLWKFSVQIGPLAAQNVPHVHYHLYRPNTMFYNSEWWMLDDNPLPVYRIWRHSDYFDLPEHFVFNQGPFRVSAGGYRTGMLYILPEMEPVAFTHERMPDLGELINRVVTTFIAKFTSVEGQGPDYRFEFEIYDGEVTGGAFVPRLNNTGTLEDTAVHDDRTPFNLLWSHEETARYLRE